MPILSFIIPLYNTGQFISKCLSSIVENDVDKALYEVIIVDDGSSDSSASIVNDFALRFQNITFVRQKHEGVSKARMNGVSIAKGDYIWFIDSDDYLIPDSTKECLNLISHYKSIDVFVTQMAFVSDNGDTLSVFPNNTESYVIDGKNLLKNKQLRIVGPPQFIIKKTLFQNEWLFFPDGTRFEDEYFSRVLKYVDCRFLILDKCFYCYRQWSGSHMNSVRVQNMQDIISVYGYLDKYANEVVSSEDIPWFRNNIVSFLLESYTRNSDYFKSVEFVQFRNKNNHFIRREWNEYRRFFSFKDRVLIQILLCNPVLYRFLIHINNLRKLNRIIN